MKKTSLVIALMLISVLTIGCTSTASSPQVERTKVGAILPLSGELESKAQAHKAALETALDNVNDYLTNSGQGFTIDLIIEDSENDPDKVVELLADLKKQGVKICIGPLSSAETLAAKPFADENDVLLLSPASTAPSLAMEDNVYRFMPNDIYQAEAITTLLQSEGACLLVPIYRDDNYGTDFSNQLKRTDKILVANGFPYDSKEYDISKLVKDLNDGVSTLLHEDTDLSQVAVVAVGFGEVKDILKEASKYENLTKLKWIGTDGIALNNEVLSNAEVVHFINKVDFKASAFGTDQTTYYNKINQQIAENLGREPDAESLVTYDILRIVASLYEKHGLQAEFADLKANLAETAKLNPGASGWMMLDENGDCRYSLYDFWGVKDSAWVRYAKYRRDPGLEGYIVYP